MGNSELGEHERKKLVGRERRREEMELRVTVAGVGLV
jgi:hypothetical protein